MPQINQSPGQILLAVFLILTGLALLVGLTVSPILLGLVVLAAGLLIFFGK